MLEKRPRASTVDAVKPEKTTASDTDASATSANAAPKKRGGARPGAGAPKGNKNGLGNRGGPGAPKGNRYAVGHGRPRVNPAEPCTVKINIALTATDAARLKERASEAGQTAPQYLRFLINNL